MSGYSYDPTFASQILQEDIPSLSKEEADGIAYLAEALMKVEAKKKVAEEYGDEGDDD